MADILETAMEVTNSEESYDVCGIYKNEMSRNTICTFKDRYLMICYLKIVDHRRSCKDISLEKMLVHRNLLLKLSTGICPSTFQFACVKCRKYIV
jgi:hypothetical protein